MVKQLAPKKGRSESKSSPLHEDAKKEKERSQTKEKKGFFENLDEEEQALELERRKKREEKAEKEALKARREAERKEAEAKQKKREDLLWKQEENTGAKKASKSPYMLKSVQYGDYWYVEYPPGTWVEAKMEWYCVLCKKHISSANVQMHLGTSDHMKQEWHETQKNAGGGAAAAVVAPPPGLWATASSSSAHMKHVDTDVIEARRDNEWEQDYYYCVACEKIADDFHLASDKHAQRVHAYKESLKPHEQPDEEWLMWVPWGSGQPQSHAELQMKCLLCEKFCNDEESHGTSLNQKLSQLHRKRLMDYDKYGYREAVLEERAKIEAEFPLCKKITEARRLPLVPFSEDFHHQAALMKAKFAVTTEQSAGADRGIGREEFSWNGRHVEETRGSPPPMPAPTPPPRPAGPPPPAPASYGSPHRSGISGHGMNGHGMNGHGVNGHVSRQEPVQLPRNGFEDDDGFQPAKSGKKQKNKITQGKYGRCTHIAAKEYDGFEVSADGQEEGGYLRFICGDALEKKCPAQRGDPSNKFPEYAYFVNIDTRAEGWAPYCHVTEQ